MGEVSATATQDFTNRGGLKIRIFRVDAIFLKKNLYVDTGENGSIGKWIDKEGFLRLKATNHESDRESNGLEVKSTSLGNQLVNKGKSKRYAPSAF
jgi:hypothetical protein